ncbi:MAG: hypothetical protein JWM11_342 [Planctomycetaceae bacterium]|nr:hypothetical protein [Planctomycetaceae bacterium]
MRLMGQKNAFSHKSHMSHKSHWNKRRPEPALPNKSRCSINDAVSSKVSQIILLNRDPDLNPSQTCHGIEVLRVTLEARSRE